MLGNRHIRANTQLVILSTTPRCLVEDGSANLFPDALNYLVIIPTVVFLDLRKIHMELSYAGV
jgi:hypothetical protein